MLRRALLLSLPLLSSYLLLGVTTLPSVSLTPYGYVKGEQWFDSHQVLGFAENEALIYPLPFTPDRCCRDINAHGQSAMSALETRLGVNIEGPAIHRAKSGALVEGDFIGSFYNNVLRFRLRHAYLTLDWDSFSLWAGQTWHPAFIEECYANTVSFNSGDPFDPVARDPQIRGVYHADYFNAIFCLSEPLIAVCDGPYGPSPRYTRDAVMPNIHFQVKGFLKTHFIGAGLDVKRLVPRLVTNKDIKTSESLTSWVTFGYASFRFDNIVWNNKVTFAQNATNLNMLGGYAVHSVDPLTDFRTYTNLSVIAAWTDLQWRHKRFEPGVLIGFGKNMGSNKSIIEGIPNNEGVIEPTVYGVGTRVDHIERISPRLRIFWKPFIFGAELEITHTSFGTLDCNGRVSCAQGVTNARVLFAFYYVF